MAPAYAVPACLQLIRPECVSVRSIYRQDFAV